MNSTTDICNLALQRLGEQRISSIDDEDDKNARVCKINYEQARDTVLAASRWSCAKAQASISKLAEAPIYKWQAAYQLPSDLLRLLEIEGNDVWEPKEYFDILGRKLMCYDTDSYDEPSDSLMIEYIRREDDTTLFSPLLIECISVKLAELCARSLTGSDSKADALLEHFTRVSMPEAQMHNFHQIYSGHNHPIRATQQASFLRKARRSGFQSNSGLDR